MSATSSPKKIPEHLDRIKLSLLMSSFLPCLQTRGQLFPMPFRHMEYLGLSMSPHTTCSLFSIAMINSNLVLLFLTMGEEMFRIEKSSLLPPATNINFFRRSYFSS